jgi:hypothetical protein
VDSDGTIDKRELSVVDMVRNDVEQKLLGSVA